MSRKCTYCGSEDHAIIVSAGVELNTCTEEWMPDEFEKDVEF